MHSLLAPQAGRQKPENQNIKIQIIPNQAQSSKSKNI